MTEDEFITWAVDLPAKEWTEFARRVWWMHLRGGGVSEDRLVEVRRGRPRSTVHQSPTHWLPTVPHVEDQENWMRLRGEIRKNRRSARSHSWASRQPENKEKTREYSRLYMREYRRRKKHG